MVPLEGGILSARICRSSAVSGVETERFRYQIDLKRRQKGSENNQNWANREPKWGKKLSKTLPAEQRRKRCQNVCSVLILLDDRFGLKSFKHFIESSSRNRSRKSWNICQKASKMEPKSMPEIIKHWNWRKEAPRWAQEGHHEPQITEHFTYKKRNFQCKNNTFRVRLLRRSQEAQEGSQEALEELQDLKIKGSNNESKKY